MTFAIMLWSLPLIAIAAFVLSIFGSTRTRFTAGMGVLVFFIGFGVGQLPPLFLMEGSAIGFVLASGVLETIGVGLLALAAILPPPRQTSTNYGAPAPGLYGNPPQPPSHQALPTHQHPPAPGRYDHLPRAGEGHNQPGR